MNQINTKEHQCSDTNTLNSIAQYLVACYASLHPAMSVLLHFYSHPPTRDYDNRVSCLVNLHAHLSSTLSTTSSHIQTKTELIILNRVSNILNTLNQATPAFMLIWFRLDHLHVRYCIGNRNNAIYNFAGPVVRRRAFDPNIYPLCYKHLIDPSDYLEKESRTRGLCIPTSVALAILIQGDQCNFSRISKRDVRETTHLLNFHSLLTRKKGQHNPSISIQQFKEFEDLNQPFSKRMLEKKAYLGKYSGLSLNLFRAQVLKKSDNNNSTSIHLFPYVLSRFNESQSHLQCDLIVDSEDLWITDENDEFKINDPETNVTDHVLLIKDLNTFLYSNSPLTNIRTNGSKTCQYVHRTCLTFFSHHEQLVDHCKICQPFPTGGKVKKRKPRNKILLNHIYTNPMTGKKTPNGLMFKRSSLKHTVKPLLLSSIDLEAFLLDVPTDQRSPGSNTHKINQIFCYSLAHRSLYPHFPLPPELASPRALIKHENTSEADFMLQLVLQLRKDSALQSKFITDCLKLDPGVPVYQNFPEEIKTAFDLSKHCAHCGNRFYSRRVIKENTNVAAVSSFRGYKLKFSKSKVLPTKDHCHLSMAASLSAWVTTRDLSVFSRVHATLQPAFVHRLVGRLVGWPCHTLFLWPHCSCPNSLMTSDVPLPTRTRLR